ncbi:ATP-NAD kinase family protein [Natranaerobius trueperi]|uniref:ATP-NAD kinase n=1 Tax=Natranaerobius trueperi TaxID=759412 RepID=A0A226BUL6_9FIRM|nr:ATP-NAD kinase family protein [Natranaerobius trueperi]OWZ82728.1 ATP-NAD kinase [Natranaerobius trueperi]
MKIGLIVNPIAGMGGRVGLKGTDGQDILEQAISKGAVPEASLKTKKALTKLVSLGDDVELVTYPLDMGENPVKEAGLSPKVIEIEKSTLLGKTTPEDTVKGAQKLLEYGVDLLIFSGGDGTARNIYDAIGTKIPTIGIPAGVKIHSAVFGTSPDRAGELVLEYCKGNKVPVREREVMDIDEKAFRAGRVSAELHGYLQVPEREGLVQSLKSSGGPGEGVATTHIADHVIAYMKKDTYYLIGPGTTTRRIMERLGLDYTLLGVDIVYNNELICKDAGEREILDIILGKNAHIVVTIIGGQGYIFGRGNQQFSPSVLKEVKKRNITVIAPQEKLASLGGESLLIDTGDSDINHYLSGYYRVVVGYEREIMYPAKG